MPETPVLENPQAPLKVPPYSLEAEQSVLGGLMLDNSAWDEIADRLSEKDFYRRDHRLIFRAIQTLAEQDQPIDVLTVMDWLKKHQLLEDAGGLSYLGLLAKNIPSAANIGAYADIVRERAVLRNLIQVGTAIVNCAFEPQGRDTKALLDEAEKRVFEIAEQTSRHRSSLKPIKDLMLKAVDRIDTLYHQDSPITGIPTGFDDLDEMTSGLQDSDLIIVAGRPSMGKTALALNIAENAAIKHKLPVVMFSMEMPGEQLAMRLLASLSHIDQHKMRTGKLDDEDWPRLTSASTLLSEATLFVDDTPALTPTELRARCRRLKREQGRLGLVIVDYLQLMQVHGNKESRAVEISEISRSLKALAKELEVPVMALSQLNRSLEQRPDKRPRMSDLRESGCLTGDTMIPVADHGLRVPLRDLIGQAGFRVWALDPSTMRLCPAEVSRAFRTGMKPVYRLRTRSGRCIKATANHPFLTVKGWKRLDALQPGEQVAVPRKIPSNPKSELSETELALLGHLGTLDDPKPLATSDIDWDAIQSIEYVGEEEVFDLTVPGLHN
ncbi:MAG: replicative DNA helicase, partial [Gammaproteobacteria bacterium]